MDFVRRHLCAFSLGLIVTLAFVVVFWPLLESPDDFRFFGYGDSWTYYGPVLFFVDSAIHAGEFPLWNPLILMGQPIPGNPQYMLFYPPSLIRSVLTFDPTPFRTHVGMAVLQWLHVLLAAYGTFWAARAMKQSPAAALVAGFAFAFSAALINRVFGHHYIVYVVAWWPVALCCLHQVMHADGWRVRIRWMLLLGAAFAMSLLGGAPQLTFMTGFALVLYWLIVRVDGLIDLLRTKSPIVRLGAVVRDDVASGVVSVVFALLLAAPLLGPGLQFARYTPRGSGTGAKYESGFEDSGWNLFELVSVYSGSPVYEGFKTLSACAILLCVPAIFSASWRVPLRVLILAALLIDASRDGSWFVLDAAVRLSPVPITAAARHTMLACVPLALLAGFGFDTIRAGSIPPKRRVAASAFVAIAGAGMAWAIFRNLPRVSLDITPLVTVLPLLAALSFAIGVLRPGARWLLVPALIAIAAEPMYWGQRSMWGIASRSDRAFDLGAAVAHGRPAIWSENTRGTTTRPNTLLYERKATINGYDPLFLQGIMETLYPGSSGASFMRAADPFAMATKTNKTFSVFKRPFWLHREYVDGEMPPLGREFPVTRTVYLRDPGQLIVPRIRSDEVRDVMFSDNLRVLTVTNRPARFTPVQHPAPADPLMWRSTIDVPPQHKTLSLYIRNDRPITLAVLAGSGEEGGRDPQVVASATLDGIGDAMQRVDLPMPDLDEFVIGLIMNFPEDEGNVTLERVEMPVDLDDETQHIEIVNRTANTIDVEVRDLPGPRILSHIDFNYPGWRGYVDGAEVPVLTAFSHFKAVEVPAGTHRVRFEFRPRIVYTSIGIGAIAAAMWVALFVWSLRAPRAAG